MANWGLQLLAFSIAILDWIGLRASTSIPQWQMIDITGQAMDKELCRVIQNLGLCGCTAHLS